MKKVTIIVPCYNEQESLPYFYQETVSVLQKINYDYEFLFVNDGSKDGTLPILRELAAQDNTLPIFPFPVTSERKLPCLPGSAMLPVIMWR